MRVPRGLPERRKARYSRSQSVGQTLANSKVFRDDEGVSVVSLGMFSGLTYHKGEVRSTSVEANIRKAAPYALARCPTAVLNTIEYKEAVH